MSLKRKGTWLAAWVLVGWLVGGPAPAQGLRDAQIFAPAEPAHYGGGVRANQGFFFTYDALYWTMSPPERSTFGVDTDSLTVQRQVWWANDANQTSTQGSTMNTSFLQSDFVPGQRIELGYINDHQGWLFSYFQLHWLSQGQILPGVQAYFNDQNWGVNNLPHLSIQTAAGATPVAAPVFFDNAVLENSTRAWGTEFNYLVRTHPGQRGGMWEWYFGARYLEFDEQFDVHANGTPPVTILADTVFTNYATNKLFGPQIGLRWFKTNDRWELSLQGKFMAAWNAQSVRLNGGVASDLTSAAAPFPRQPFFPLALTPTSVDDSAHMSVFSPVVELRVEGKYQLTSRVAFKAGWNGMYVGELARPSRMVDYTLYQTHVLGILRNMNRDLCFLQGLGIGIEINR
jgi:hypothetical protein